MKKVFAYITAISAIFSLVACAPEATIPETTVGATEPTQITTQPPEAQAPTEAPTTEATFVPAAENLYSVSLPVSRDITAADDGTVLFTHAYPAMYLTIPDKDVADKIIIDFIGRVEQTNTDASQLRDQALSKDHTAASFEPYRYQLHYDPMRIDQGILSLHGHITQIGSSAHSGKQCLSANYNMITGDVLTLGSILYHANTKQQLEEMIIAALEQRTDLSLFDDFRDLIKTRFAQDESFYEDFYFNTTGLCFYFSPYEIAPYASGTITVELPYPELTGIIADAFFPAERIPSGGDLQVIGFEAADLDTYSQFTEIIVHADAQKLLLTTDTAVHNVRLIQLYRDTDGAILQENTIFAANMLSATEAVLIDAQFDSAHPEFVVSYYKDGICTEYYITVTDGQYTLSAMN